MRPFDKSLWGNILVLLMDEVVTTNDIARALGENLQRIRIQLILMHHFDLVAPVGVREDTSPPGAFGYYKDLLWETTRHMREHNHLQPGCRGCWVRENLFLTEVLYE
jgi:hypothetical protein